MPIFYMETKSKASDMPGPIDPKTGWPYPRFMVDAPNEQEARISFEKMRPGDVLEVLPY